MSEMSHYVCWTDRAVIEATPLDAASLGPGHFHAVHHPLKAQRRPVGIRTGGRWVSETDITRVLEGPLRPDGYLLMPIVGQSGTGKSHLVRWAWNRTKDRANWESRYLAKNRTSIRRAIAIVIRGLEGPAINTAREALQKAPARSESDEVLAERLLDELALITAEGSGEESDIADRRMAQMAAKIRRDLPDILRDPVVRRRLTADNAVIPRLVGLAKRGRGDGDGLDNNAIRVVDDDLPLTITSVGEASKGAREFLALLAVHPGLRSAAVDLINEALPIAVKRVFLSGEIDLIEVFREVRRELLAAGKELVLFIEDLTVLHGVEREFLDAIIEPARSPGGDLCGLRVLFAVTDGHFDGLDTVRTRCDDAYWLDTAYGPDGIDHEEAISFLGRYLNACRQNPAEVENLWANRQGDVWIPNACDPCDHQVHCHETFGRSEEGYGIYPYNRAAINRLMGSLSSNRFDPREVVRKLVNRFLILAATDLQRGGFPSDELVGPFNEHSEPLDPLVQSEIKSKRPVDYARVVNAVRYWSYSSEIVGEATLAAFGLDQLGKLEGPPTPQPSPEDKPTFSGMPASHLRAPWSGIFNGLTVWAGNERDLSMPATNNLKKLVRKSILQNLDFSALPINTGAAFNDQKRFDHQRHIHIAGSVTDQSLGDPIVAIEQDADTAAALQGLILLAELPDSDDYRGADNYRRQAARYLEEWTLSVMEHLEQSPEPTASQAIVGLLVCAIVAGACEKVSDPRDFLAGLFGAAKSAGGSHRSDRWQDVVREADRTYRRLRPIVEAHFGEARGAGATRAIRADEILKVIRDFTKSGRLESSDAAIDRFMRSVMQATEGEWRALEHLATGAAPLLDRSRSWSDQTKSVFRLVDTAHRSGRLRDPDAARVLRELASSLEEDSPRLLLKAAELVHDDPPFIEKLQVVASRLPETVTVIHKFMTRAEQAISGITKDLNERRASESEDETLDDVMSQILASLNLLEAAVEELEK